MFASKIPPIVWALYHKRDSNARSTATLIQCGETPGSNRQRRRCRFPASPQWHSGMIKGIHPCKIGIEHFPALHITAGLGGGGFTGGAATIIGVAAGTRCYHRAHIGKQCLCMPCLHHAARFCCRLAGQIRRAIHAAIGDGRYATGKVQRCVRQLPLPKPSSASWPGDASTDRDGSRPAAL